MTYLAIADHSDRILLTAHSISANLPSHLEVSYFEVQVHTSPKVSEVLAIVLRHQSPVHNASVR